jgi:hypothetical protein
MLGACAQEAQGQTIGDVYRVLGFCQGEESARKLSKAVRSDGFDGYNRVMHDRNVECFDLRVHGILGAKYFEVTLLEYKWLLITKDRDQFEFWQATDGESFDGYVWIKVKGETI